MSAITATPTETTTTPARGTYALDATHSRIGFAVRHAMVSKVRGSFTEFAGQGLIDDDNLADSHLSLTIEAASVTTGNDDRDAHLRTNDFFDMEQYPQLTFASTAFEKVGVDYRVTGDLTLKGVTKPVTVDFAYLGSAVDPYGNQRIAFEGKATIKRSDWGVNWNSALEAGGVLVSEKVQLEFDVSAIRIDA